MSADHFINDPLTEDGDIRLGVLVSHLRTEEKAIFESARRKGMNINPIFDRKIVLDLSNNSGSANAEFPYDVVLDCDDKALCSLALGAAGVPTPRTLLAFSIESALEACEMLGYPAVLKPVTGSWGRLLAKVNGPQQAKALMEQKVTLGSYQHALFYVQEYQEKPGRDIRVFVVGDRVLAASYRSADHWITNTARGASSSKCPITPQIEEIVMYACNSVGARLAGVDLIETYDGYTVLEVNTGGEFHGLMTTTDVDIAGEIVDETMRIARASAMRRLETIATTGD